MSATVRFPSDPLYRNFFLRTIAHASSLGADSGECFKALHDAGSTITPASWCTAWTKMATRLEEHATAMLEVNPPQKVSAKLAFLRASNYHRAAFAPLFGYPLDKETVMPAYQAMRRTFGKAAELFEPPLVALEIPFKGATLRGYLANPPETVTSRNRLMVNINGYDAPMEEMYFFTGHQALNQGYSFLMFDGPGQGGTLLEEGMTLAHNYDEVLSAVLDVVEKHGSWKHTVVQGLSLGGLLCLKAVASPLTQPRIDAMIADPGESSLEDAFKARIPFPQYICDQLPNGPGWAVTMLDFILHRMIAGKGQPGWALRRGLLVHGCKSPLEYVRTLHEFDNKPILGKITVPTLVTKADDDDLAAQADFVFESMTACEKKELMRFTEDEGAEEHCETGARTFYSERIFGWLDTILSH